MSGATVYSFDDGRISGHWQIAGKLGMVLQLRAPAARTKMAVAGRRRRASFAPTMKETRP